MLDGKIETCTSTKPGCRTRAFHDFYGDYHAIGADRPRCRTDDVFDAIDHKAAGRAVAGLADPGAGRRTTSSTATCSAGLPDAHLDLARSTRSSPPATSPQR